MAHAGRRVVVTGLGLVTPLGNDVATNWQALLAGRSGISRVSHFDPSALPAQIAGEVRGFDPSVYIEKKEIKKMDPFIHYAIAAAQMAVDDAGRGCLARQPERCGVVVGVGMGGIGTIEECHSNFLDGGVKKLSPFFIPRLIANMAPAQVAMRFGLKGFNYALVSACASGGHAVGEAGRLIRSGEQDVVLAGGAEAGVTPLCMAGFAAMRALSVRNDEPERASRPFDRLRDGFVVAEGAGMLVLEDLERALDRGAPIYAELIGYGATADAYHITNPSPDGAARCIQQALRQADLEPSEVDYINAHGTSTPQNDRNETEAIKAVFGTQPRVAVSSTKSMTGHMLGAAGAVEAAYTALAVRHGVIPPTINYEHPDPECDLDYVPNQARRTSVEVAISNAFGFGGANSCVAFRRYEAGSK